LPLKFVIKANKTQNFFIYFKCDKGIKNAKFVADFDYVEKVAKNTCENVINEKITEKWSY